MKHGSNLTSPIVLSLNISWPLHSFIKLLLKNKSLIQFLLLLPSLSRMLPPMKKQILKSHLFLSLEGDFSSYDTIDEKEVTYGADIDIDDDPITHSLFSISPILDSEIYVPDPSHFVHTSLLDGAQPIDFWSLAVSCGTPSHRNFSP